MLCVLNPLYFLLNPLKETVMIPAKYVSLVDSGVSQPKKVEVLNKQMLCMSGL